MRWCGPPKYSGLCERQKVLKLLKTPENIDETKRLIEAGFEYVCTHENLMLFRKCK